MTEEQYEFENDYLTMVRIMEKEWNHHRMEMKGVII